MKAKTYIISCLCGIFALLFAVGCFVYYVDPYFQYHAPRENLAYELKTDSFSYYNAGILKNFSYDTVITGSSMSRAFLPSHIDEQFSCQTVKLSMPEARGKDYSLILPAVASKKTTKRIIIGLDTFAYTVDKDYMAHEKPNHLYDTNITNDVLYLTNMDGLIESVETIKHTTEGSSTTTMDNYQNYVPTNTFSRANCISRYQGIYKKNAPSVTNLKAQEKTITDNLNQNLIPTIKEHPDIDFLFYFPPYSIVRWGNTADITAEIDAMRVIIDTLIDYPNVSLFFYQGKQDCITDLSHYMDSIHFDSTVANDIVDYMKSSDNKLTRDNYTNVLDEFQKFVINYDYDSLLE